MIVDKMIVVLVLLSISMAHAFEEECKDYSAMCRAWKRFCVDKYNKMYMEMYCKDTCGWCPKCQDRIPPLGCTPDVCMNPQRSEYARENCRRSCGLCTPPTTEPPAPPTPAWIVKPAGRCGTPKMRTRVIGGVNAKKGSWPWQVLIRFLGQPHCGGTLVSPWWVVTAAHCVYGNEKLIDEYNVITGEHDFDVDEGTETSIHLSKMVVHEKYSRRTLDNDIALLKLNRPAPFDSGVGTACLPEQGSEVPAGTNCMITGWGKISATGTMHHYLQQAKIPVISNEQCYNLNLNKTNIEVTTNMLCAGYGPGNRISGCHGDSGGPLVCLSKDSHQWYLQGAVSWGSSKCDTKEAYTVFARIGQLREWIDQKMNE